MLEGYDAEEWEKRLRSARLMLAIALLGAVVTPFALFGNKTGVFMVAWVASFLGGLVGVRDAARLTGTSPWVMYPALVAVFMPVLNLLPLAYFLVRANGALANPPEDVEEPAAPSPPPRRAAAASSARPAPKGLRGAIACIKSASLGGQVPEGESLTARAVQPAVEMAEADLPVMRASLGHFAVCYMIDEGSHYAYANHGQLKAAGMTLEELHRLAVGNLAALVDAKPGLKMHPQPGFQGLTLDGQFEASLMLVDALWDRALAQQAPNGAVVTIPSRDVCAFCDASSAEGVKQLRAMAARVGAGGSHLLTDKLFVRAGGRWREFGAEAKKDLPPLEFGR